MLMSNDGSLNPHELIVSALHSINLHHKLECLDESNQICEFPASWKEQPDGSFTFRYKNNSRSSVVKFKMTVEGKYVIVVFCEEGTKESYRVTIDSNEHMESIIKQYTFTLKQYLSKEGGTKPANIQQSPLQLPNNGSNQGRPPNSFVSEKVQPVYPPKNVIHPNPGNFQNPFGQEEYVGPNSNVFNNPYYSQQPKPEGSLMIPPGARYDPVDPFDNPLLEKKDEPNDFVMGFD